MIEPMAPDPRDPSLSETLEAGLVGLLVALALLNGANVLIRLTGA